MKNKEKELLDLIREVEKTLEEIKKYDTDYRLQKIEADIEAIKDHLNIF